MKNMKKNILMRKKKIKKKNINESSSFPDSNLNKSTSSLLDDETISKINVYYPKLIKFMNKDPYLFPLDYSSIYKTQVQGKFNIDIKIETIYNFFKQLQDVNDKLVKICNINPNINSLFSIKYFNTKQMNQIQKYNISDYNKLWEDINACNFLLKLIKKEKTFHNKDIHINFNNFIKDNMNLFPRTLIMNNKLIDIETFLELKILHMENFINFVSKKFGRQKESVENILLIDQNEFYGLYSLAYIRLIQLNIPESSELVNYMLSKKEIVEVPLYCYALNFMKSLIDKFNQNIQ